MGKFLAVLLVGSAFGAGIFMYYLQVYGFYDEVVGGDVQLVSVVETCPKPSASTICKPSTPTAHPCATARVLPQTLACHCCPKPT